MKNASSNTETAPVTELPESVRIPLHSLQADLEYLIGRVIADGSCGPMVVKSMRERLDQIEVEVRERAEAIEVVKRLRAILHYDEPLAVWTDDFLSRVGTGKQP